MLKRFCLFLCSIALLLHCYGCVAVLAGAAGGAGTAAWLSGKMMQEVSSSPQKSLKAVKAAFKSKGYFVTKETIKEDVIQVLGKDINGKKIWVDIIPVISSGSKVQVRVGLLSDKEAARTLLAEIVKNL